jgi:hypothetical protein
MRPAGGGSDPRVIMHTVVPRISPGRRPSTAISHVQPNHRARHRARHACAATQGRGKARRLPCRGRGGSGCCIRACHAGANRCTQCADGSRPKKTQQAADRAEAAVKTAVPRHDALSQRGDAGVCASGASTASHGRTAAVVAGADSKCADSPRLQAGQASPVRMLAGSTSGRRAVS